MLRSPSSDPLDQKPRACLSCSKAKSKCILPISNSNSKCSRCFRLQKECIIPPKSTKKRKSPTHTLNIGHLEQRIDSLVSLLSNAEEAVTKKSYLTPPESQDQHNSLTSTDIIQEVESLRAQVTVSSEISKTSWNDQTLQRLPENANPKGQYPLAPAGSNVPSGSILYKPFPIIPISETPFEIYRKRFDPQLPFSFIPQDMSSDELQAQKPWLYRTCSMVGMIEDKGRQTEAAEKIILEISQGMLIRGDKSLDMLQSLLIYNAWSYYFARVSPSKKSHADFQLAIAMLYDLGLPKKVPENDGPIELLSESMVREVPENSMLEKRSAEERRVLLACYVLASVYSVYLRRIDISLVYSPYIGYCCESILSGLQDEKDLLLVSLVRLQSKVEAFYRSLPTKATFEEIKAPMWMYVKSVEADLENYWLSLPINIKDNFFMVLHYRTARVLLYEISLQKTLFPMAAFELPNSRRLDMLYTCLLSCQQALDLFIAQPLQFYATLPGLLLSHLGHSLSTLLKLSMIEVPGWDLDHVRQTVNVDTYFEEFTRRLEEVGASLDRYKISPKSLPSMPSMCARAMKKIKGWYDTKITVEPNRDTQQQATENLGADFNMDIDLFDLNDSYWLDLMSDSNLQ